MFEYTFENSNNFRYTLKWEKKLLTRKVKLNDKRNRKTDEAFLRVLPMNLDTLCFFRQNSSGSGITSKKLQKHVYSESIIERTMVYWLGGISFKNF